MIAENEKMKTAEETYEDAKLALAICRLMKRDAAAAEPSAAVCEAAEKSLPRMLKLIDQHERRNHTRQMLMQQAFRVLKVAAMVVLVLNLTLTVATAVDSNVRSKVIDFFAFDNGSVLDIRFNAVTEDLLIPELWAESYYPTYIPEGYTLQYIDSYPGMSEMEYRDAQNRTVEIQISGTGSTTLINSENTDVSQIPLHGVTATILRQPYEEVDIFWSIGNRIFVVYAPDYETALSVAEGIKIIEKK